MSRGAPPARSIEVPPRAETLARQGSAPSRSRPNRAQSILASGVAIAVLALALFAGVRGRTNSPVTADDRRIVVAMFENQTGDSTLNSLQLLAADWMTRGIAETPGVDMLYPGVLYVQGRTASGVNTAALELAKDNGAQLAIAGTFYRSSDSLFFAGNLIDVASGRVIRALGPFPTSQSTPLEGMKRCGRVLQLHSRRCSICGYTILSRARLICRVSMRIASSSPLRSFTGTAT